MSRGIAVLRFMDRSGRVLTAAISRSAGNPALDDAALAAAAPGSPCRRCQTACRSSG
ncbi:MAG: hypothetical protein ABW003_13925 [Microvirga sp.]